MAKSSGTNLRLDESTLAEADAIIPAIVAAEHLRPPSERRLSRHAILVEAVRVGLRAIREQPSLISEPSDTNTIIVRAGG